MDRLKKRLLLVEDDKDIAESLRMILEEEGYTVFHVSNGECALEILDHNPTLFHVAIVDLIVPGPKGDEIARVMRERELMTPIIIMSGAGPSWLREANLHHADAFIAKPMDINKLYELVSSLSNKHADLKSA